MLNRGTKTVTTDRSTVSIDDPLRLFNFSANFSFIGANMTVKAVDQIRIERMGLRKRMKRMLVAIAIINSDCRSAPIGRLVRGSLVSICQSNQKRGGYPRAI